MTVMLYVRKLTLRSEVLKEMSKAKPVTVRVSRNPRGSFNVDPQTGLHGRFSCHSEKKGIHLFYWVRFIYFTFCSLFLV